MTPAPVYSLALQSFFENWPAFGTVLNWLLYAFIAALVLGTVLILLAMRQVRRINIPPDADFATTLRHTPFIVVLGIDLLDFALDIFAAPLTWFILDGMGLKALRNVSAVEALIPFTQPIPTLTLCWIGARWFKVDF